MILEIVSRRFILKLLYLSGLEVFLAWNLVRHCVYIFSLGGLGVELELLNDTAVEFADIACGKAVKWERRACILVFFFLYFFHEQTIVVLNVSGIIA